jgi:hypothetical protein
LKTQNRREKRALKAAFQGEGLQSVTYEMLHCKNASKIIALQDARPEKVISLTTLFRPTLNQGGEKRSVART